MYLSFPVIYQCPTDVRILIDVFEHETNHDDFLDTSRPGYSFSVIKYALQHFRLIHYSVVVSQDATLPNHVFVWHIVLKILWIIQLQLTYEHCMFVEGFKLSLQGTKPPLKDSDYISVVSIYLLSAGNFQLFENSPCTTSTHHSYRFINAVEHKQGSDQCPHV